MADQKITELTNQAAPADADLVEGVDVSDNTMAVSGTNKKHTLAVIRDFFKATYDTLYDAIGAAAGVQSNLDTHEADLANPHVVTLAQVGGDPAGSAAIVQGNLDDHEADLANPHVVTAAQAGADPVGSAATVQGNLDTHEADTDIHYADAPVDGTVYSRQNNAWTPTPTGSVGGAVLNYVFQDDVAVSDPLTGNIKVNNASMVAADTISVSDVTDLGNDLGAVLDSLKATDYVGISDGVQGNSTYYQLTGDTVDQTGWHSIPVVGVPGGASDINDGRPIDFILIFNPDRFASDFLELDDTPADYTDDDLKTVRVNTGETGLEFGPRFYVQDAEPTPGNASEDDIWIS